MQIALEKPELQRFIDELVKSGRFASAQEVVEAALARLMIDPVPDELDDDTWEAIDRAESEFIRGEDQPFAEVAAVLGASI